jgi:hypothetical protein
MPPIYFGKNTHLRAESALIQRKEQRFSSPARRPACYTGADAEADVRAHARQEPSR